MRIAFLGTPAAAVPSLEAFAAAADVEVVAVITNPDRPKGRSGQPAPPPVKVAAQNHELPVWQPTKPREVVDDLRGLDLDAAAVVAYGALLPPAVLAAAGRGFVNLHFSLLPRWRGAAPVQHAIRAGDTVTGVSCFVLDEGMDTGPLLAVREEPIRPEDTTGSLLDRLATIGAPVLVDAVRAFVAGRVPTPQPTEGVTLAPKVAPADVEIDWTATTRAVAALVRSADPAPGAHTSFRGGRLKVWAVAEAVGVAPAVPGEIVAAERDGPVVATGDGGIRLTVVQPEGRARIDGSAFVNGYQPRPGERLGVR